MRNFKSVRCRAAVHAVCSRPPNFGAQIRDFIPDVHRRWHAKKAKSKAAVKNGTKCHTASYASEIIVGTLVVFADG